MPYVKRSGQSWTNSSEATRHHPRKLSRYLSQLSCFDSEQEAHTEEAQLTFNHARRRSGPI